MAGRLRLGRTTALPALLALVAVAPAAAQAQAAAQDSVLVVGRVEDATTGTPLVAAIVRAPGLDLQTLSDQGGIFTLHLPAETVHVQVDRFGYEIADFDVRVEPGLPPILQVDPLPMLVDGVTVTVDRLAAAAQRLESRMRSIPFLTRTMDARDLAEAVSTDPLMALSGVGAHMSACPGGGEPYGCLMQRGKLSPVSIYLDEMPLVGGTEHFAMIPTDALYRIEVIPRLGQIRAYTRRYVAWMAAGNRHPAPIIW